ncbi:MAG: alpha/beta hydrolase [Candidimonas sp.]|nr:alpha/beta hydrolase [Candidimonas sp.]
MILDLDQEYDNVKKVAPEYFRRVLAQLDAANTAARRKHRAVLDVPYGASGQECLDIFQAGNSGMPVQVFFHGGYWHSLDKRDFSFIADGLVPHDVTAVVVNFPHLPDVRMDAQIAACRRALRWVYDNINNYGGDPQQLSVSGHSAGAHIAAMLLVDDPEQAADATPPIVEHACLVSGIYDLDPIKRCFVNDTLQLSAADVVNNSPVRLRPRTACPLALVVGMDEGREYLRQTHDLARAWGDFEHDLSLSALENENHFSLRAQFGDPDSKVIKLAVGSGLAITHAVNRMRDCKT